MSTPIGSLAKSLLEGTDIRAADRKIITNALYKIPEIKGTVRVPKLGVAIQKIASALDSCGFTLDIDYGIYSTEDDFWAAVAEELGAEHFDLAEFVPQPEITQLIPAGMARLYGAFPVTMDSSSLHVAFTDPLNPQLLEDLRFALGRDVVPVVARRSQVQELIDKHYGTGTPSIEEIFGQMGMGAGGLDPKALEKEANSAPIVKFVDLVMQQAIKERACQVTSFLVQGEQAPLISTEAS